MSVAKCYDCSRKAYLHRTNTKPNRQLGIKRHLPPSGCCQWLVATQAGRGTPLPAPMKSYVRKSTSAVA